jgi:threonine/homoserine/homoserine lactone efflux protein
MKRTIVGFVISALVLLGLAVWALKGRISGNAQEILNAAIVLVLVGFAIYLGITRIRSHRRREPAEDELSRKVMTRASSLAYYISIYFWLFIMSISDKTSLEAHSLVGGGILGMAVIFLLCWLGVKAFGTKDA